MSQLASAPTFVIGTAGHIDHGKSTLVKALTGTDPDRLAEEKARGMTIDLGFAFLSSPRGRSVSIVDVPGHERFIKNMLAGVGGIDVAVLVIAADEGPMPQTVEHLAILDLLGVEHGVVALTKRDLVDADWLDLIVEEVRERMTGTTLAGAPIVPVSATTGTGLPELLEAIDAVIDGVPTRAASGKPRLPIDRVFSIAGFGTVVTGTLLGGPLMTAQELRVMPLGLTTRVRGLQTHATKVDRTEPGSRVAVNIAGLTVGDVRRGDVLAGPGTLKASQRVDVRLRLLADSPVTLEQNAQVDFFSGSSEVPAWVTLLDREKLAPGDTGWVQLRFREPVAVLRGDRCIVRRPSPSITIGGGDIVDPAPIRHKRFRAEVVDALETLSAGSPDDIVLQMLETAPLELKTLRAQAPAGLSESQVSSAIEQLVAEGDVIVLGAGGGQKPNDFLVAKDSWDRIETVLDETLRAFHAANPLRKGIAREELRSRSKLGGAPRLFDEVIAAAVSHGTLAVDGSTVRQATFKIAIPPAAQPAVDRYLAALLAAPSSPPSPAEFGIEPDILGAMVDLDLVIKVADGVIYHPEAYREIEAEVIAILDRDGTISLAGFRDHFQTSRKYAQAVLEYLDQRRITRRVGDERVRFAGAGAGQLTGEPR